MSRLISLFRSLTPQEVKKFGQFLQSPYYNATPKMRGLYKYLKKEHPECLFRDEDKEKLFTQIFDNETYKLKKMNNLMASLSSILQDFLLLQNQKHGTTARKKGLFEVYKRRKLDKLSHQQLRGIRKAFEKHPDADTFRHYESLKVHHELYFHTLTKRIRWKEKEDYDYFEAAQQDLDLFYAHLSLHYICEMNFRLLKSAEKRVLNPHEEEKIEALIHLHQPPLLNIYWLLYTIIKQADKKIYSRLREFTFDYINDYKPLEFKHLLTFLMNYQNLQHISGDTDALYEMFNLYHFGLEKNLYIDDTGYFSVSHFINISIIASAVGERKWLATFIENQKENLQEGIKENIVTMSLAFLRFAQHQYDETLRLITILRRTAPAFELTCWTLEIRAYYMMKDEHENWDSSIKRFQAYLRNKENLDERTKQANRNFNTFIRLLYRTTYHNTHTKEELLAKLESKKNIVCKFWLKEQIKQLR